MAVKAAASITVAVERDISSVTRFYMLASSSITPSQPSGTEDPSGWSRAEPAYDGTSTNSLYIADRTIFTDGTAGWSQVSKSSSYEAAKQAYNEALYSRRFATDYLTETTADGLIVHPSSDSTTGWRIKDVLELLVSGVSHIWAGIQDTVAVLRVGLAAAGHVIMSGDGYVDVRNGSTVMAHFGYGEGAAMTGSESKPYYVFGLRNSVAPGNYSFNTGLFNESNGYVSYAQGYHNIVSGGLCGQASGMYLRTEKALQTVVGIANVKDTASGKRSIRTGQAASDDMGQYAFIVGNGTLRQPLPYVSGESDILRSNAFTVDWDGNIMAPGMAGMIQMFAGTSAPAGWLICNGAAVSRTEYETLFNVIGTTWGAGDGSTTFNLPDLRGRAPIGAGTGTGLTARTLGTTLGSQYLQAHTHTMAHTHGTGDSTCTHFNISDGDKVTRRQLGSSGTNRGYQWTTDSTSSSAAVTQRSATAGSSAANTGAASVTTGSEGNMQPSAVVNFIICTGKTD